MEVNSFFREKNIAEQKLLYRETFGLCPRETKTICQMLGEEKKKKTKKQAKSVKSSTFVRRSERLMPCLGCYGQGGPGKGHGGLLQVARDQQEQMLQPAGD